MNSSIGGRSLKRRQAHPVEEQLGRAVEDGLTRAPGAAALVDVLALFEEPAHAVDVHAAQRPDLGARDRLAVGDDREGLEGRRAQPVRDVATGELRDPRRRRRARSASPSRWPAPPTGSRVAPRGTRRAGRRSVAVTSAASVSATSASSSAEMGSRATVSMASRLCSSETSSLIDVHPPDVERRSPRRSTTIDVTEGRALARVRRGRACRARAGPRSAR